MKLFQRLRQRLVDDSHLWWRLWSVRFAAIAAAVVGAVTAQPQILLGLLAYVPDGWRPVAAVLAAVISFVIPTVLRLWNQSKAEK